MKTDCKTCIYETECVKKKLIGENDNCETYKSQPTIKVMTIPKPPVYVLKKEDIETAKRLSIDIEGGSTNEDVEKYQEAKDASSQYNLIKTIKSNAYKEFAAKLKLHRRKMSSADSSGEFWDYAVLEESIDSTLKELEGKL